MMEKITCSYWDEHLIHVGKMDILRQILAMDHDVVEFIIGLLL